MRMILPVTVCALCVGSIATATARTMQDSGLPAPERPQATRLSQNLPSDVEQRLGIRPNSANPDSRRGGRGGRYEVERGGRYEVERGGRGGRYEVERRRGPGGPEVERCEGLADARGLVGREFRRFVRYCLER